MRAFWARLTEGFQLEQLWGQFKSEARAGYVLYSKDVDWEVIAREKSKFKRLLLSGWALFQALLMKLSPARRVLLVFALLLLIFHPDVRWGNNEVNFDFVGVAALIMFMLLALELADRVTMKRDLEIAREIQQWLVPSEPPQIPGMDIAFATRPQNTVAGDYYDAFLRSVPEAGAIKPSASRRGRRRCREKRAGGAADGHISVRTAGSLLHTRYSGRNCRGHGPLRSRAQSGRAPLHHRISR